MGTWDALEWRLAGPHRGGRVVAVAGHPHRPLTFYFGAAAGGVFRTDDGGITWENISDGYLRTAAVGALAVAPSDPSVLYVGMGECCIRGDVSHGDGVYRSRDGGQTFQHVGLAETRHIARIRVHPHDPELVYAVALGHAFGPNPERGVYRSRDGGEHWELVLHRDQDTGAIDLAMDPSNPRILYAALWQTRRYPWGFESGGPGSGLLRSVDSGDTWSELTDAPGMPSGPKGRIGVAVSPAKPTRLYAVVEAEAGGVFRSDDAGAHWERMSEDRNLRQRAWYYTHVFAHPTDPDSVYVLNVQAWRSRDGGRTFEELPAQHGDNHDLWIDPVAPDRLILGNDGGASVSFDGGRSWSTLLNQPTAQFYHVTTDNRFPYWIYGAQQDNSTLAIPSRSDEGLLSPGEWEDVGGGESGYIVVQPDDPDVVYAGNYGLLTRYDRRTRRVTNITPWPEVAIGWAARDLRYRFQWTFPVSISPHDPTMLYAAANVVFVSRDRGQSWTEISPDLTRHDDSKLGPSGGPITKDNTSVEYYGTVFALAESPLTPGLLWAGSDDGLIHLSRDGGAHWEDVTPKFLPEWTLISIIEPSRHRPGTAFVAATRYKLDDFHPYLLRTDDYGATWRFIHNGIPTDDFTRVIRQDPVVEDLLFAGTETGVYMSRDGGAHWEDFRQNLPVVPIHDLAIHEHDLVAATHGRSFWVLEDLTPLREWPGATADDPPAVLFSSAPRVPAASPPRSRDKGPDHGTLFLAGFYAHWRRPPGSTDLTVLDAAVNPPRGLFIHYWLNALPEGEDPGLTITVTDEVGRTAAILTSREPRDTHSEKAGEKSPGEKQPRPLPRTPGLHRVVWDLAYPDAVELPGTVLWGGSLRGPEALPGTYTITLTRGDFKTAATVTLLPDPRVPPDPAAAERRFALELAIQDRLSAAHQAVLAIRSYRDQIQGWRDRLGEGDIAAALKAEGQSLLDQLTPIEERLTQPRAKSPQDVLNFPVQANTRLAALGRAAASAPHDAPHQISLVFDKLAGEVDGAIQALRGLAEGPIALWEKSLREAEVPAIQPPHLPSPRH